MAVRTTIFTVILLISQTCYAETKKEKLEQILHKVLTEAGIGREETIKISKVLIKETEKIYNQQRLTGKDKVEKIRAFLAFMGLNTNDIRLLEHEVIEAFIGPNVDRMYSDPAFRRFFTNYTKHRLGCRYPDLIWQMTLDEMPELRHKPLMRRIVKRKIYSR